MLTDHLGYWLRFVSNSVSSAFARRLAERDVTVAAWVLMRLIFEAPARPSAVAEQMGFTKGAVSKLADRLVARGLIERGPGGDDARVQLLALTATGRSLVPELAAIADGNDREFFGALEPDEAEALERLLKKIVEMKALRTVPID